MVSRDDQGTCTKFDGHRSCEKEDTISLIFTFENSTKGGITNFISLWT